VIGRGEVMRNGRDLAACFGLLPHQASTGARAKLLGISERGDSHVRTLLIHGARAALPHPAARDTPLDRWLRGLRARRHYNVAVVTLANKLARIAWALLASGRPSRLKWPPRSERPTDIGRDVATHHSP
jgi:transposase